MLNNKLTTYNKIYIPNYTLLVNVDVLYCQVYLAMFICFIRYAISVSVNSQTDSSTTGPHATQHTRARPYKEYLLTGQCHKKVCI